MLNLESQIMSITVVLKILKIVISSTQPHKLKILYFLNIANFKKYRLPRKYHSPRNDELLKLKILKNAFHRRSSFYIGSTSHQ